MASVEVRVPTQEQEVLDRLFAHGIEPADYIRIRQIVSFDIPRGVLWFSQRFGGRSINQVLGQIDGWKRFLKKDTLFTDDEKGRVERLLSGIELVTGQALIEINPNIGPWKLTAVGLPSGQDAQGQPEYLPPRLRLTAVHSDGKQSREAVISGTELNDFTKWSVAWKRALEELEIWDLVAKGAGQKRVTRAGRPQGWPIFTRKIIPRLYEYLLPHYQRPGHYSEKRDTVRSKNAQFPRELLEDMLLILRFEHPGTFEATTTSQLKATVQRHLERKRAHSTQLPK
jgi:hypothetical protein